MAPNPSVGIKPMMANRAVLIDHEGCHDSGWCPDILRHIFLLTSNLPLGVSIIIDGGFIGYSVGRIILPWYTPEAKSESGGPRTVKCHSNRLS